MLVVIAMIDHDYHGTQKQTLRSTLCSYFLQTHLQGVKIGYKIRSFDLEIQVPFMVLQSLPLRL